MRAIVRGAMGETGRAALAAETATAFVRDPVALDGRDHVVTGSADGGEPVGGEVSRADVAAVMVKEATANEGCRPPTLVW